MRFYQLFTAIILLLASHATAIEVLFSGTGWVETALPRNWDADGNGIADLVAKEEIPGGWRITIRRGDGSTILDHDLIFDDLWPDVESPYGNIYGFVSIYSEDERMLVFDIIEGIGGRSALGFLNLTTPQEAELYLDRWLRSYGDLTGDGLDNIIVGYGDSYQVWGKGPTSVHPDPDDGPTPSIPGALAIRTVAPNPFNPRTTVWLDIPRSGGVMLAVHDLRGRLVRTLWSGQMNEGRHPVVWDGMDDRGAQAPSGVYLVLLVTADGAQRAVKVTLTK